MFDTVKNSHWVSIVSEKETAGTVIKTLFAWACTKNPSPGIVVPLLFLSQVLVPVEFPRDAGILQLNISVNDEPLHQPVNPEFWVNLSWKSLLLIKSAGELKLWGKVYVKPISNDPVVSGGSVPVPSKELWETVNEIENIEPTFNKFATLVKSEVTVPKDNILLPLTVYVKLLTVEVKGVLFIVLESISV